MPRVLVLGMLAASLGVLPCWLERGIFWGNDAIVVSLALRFMCETVKPTLKPENQRSDA